MKNIEKFLFVYGLLITTTLFFAALLFAPKPSNFVLILFITPIVYYLWLKMIVLEDKKTNKAFGKKALSVVVLTLMTSTIVSSLGIYLYSKRTASETTSNVDITQPIITSDILQNQQDNQDKLPKDTQIELIQIKEELVQLRAELRSITNILGVSTSPAELQDIMSDLNNVEGTNLSNDQNSILGSVSVRDNYTRIDAHVEPVASSRIVGSINKGKAYAYSNRNGNWYLVKTDQGTIGWVFSSFVEEFIP